MNTKHKKILSLILLLTVFLIATPVFSQADEDTNGDTSQMKISEDSVAVDSKASDNAASKKEIPLKPVEKSIFTQNPKELLKQFSANSPASSAKTLDLEDYYPDQVISTRYMQSSDGKTTTWFLMYTRTSDIIETLKDIYENEISDGNVRIAENTVTNSIIIRTKEKNSPLSKEIMDTIRSMDFRTGQVMIDVLVVELTISDENLFDLELKGLSDNPAGMGNTTAIGAADHGRIDLNNPLAAANGLKTFIASQNKWKLFLNAYKNNKKANIISSPHIVAANHRKATFKIGDQIPLITSVRPSDAGPIKTFEVKEVGIELSVTPHINRSGQIDLEVFQSINNIKSYNPTEGTAQMSNREVNTNVTLGNGETLVLGGFIEKKERKETQRTPYLSKIPFIGKAFNKDQKSIEKTELLVFLTPRLLNGKSDNRRMVRYKTARITMKDKVRNLLKDRNKLAKIEHSANSTVIIPKASRGWLYDFDKKQIEDLVWEVPPKLDTSKIKLMRYGSCPFSYGESKNLIPPFVRTLLKPSEGFVFYKEFSANPAKFSSLRLKVASCNAAAVYINGLLIDEDPMIKLKDGHNYEYWNRIKGGIPTSILKKHGKNTIMVLLGNDKTTTEGYFDMQLEGIK